MFYLAVKYTFFAVIATILNLFTQFVSFAIYDRLFPVIEPWLSLPLIEEVYTLSVSILPGDDLRLYFGMAWGTLAGLMVKYYLDKKYIFYYITKRKRDDVHRFLLYSFMGVFTTLIFWGFEVGFDLYFEGEGAKYVGAVLGLAIGYITKYFLDKRFVFIYNIDVLSSGAIANNNNEEEQ